MNKRVLKYQLEFGMPTYINISKACKVLTVGMQDGKVCLWAEVPSMDILGSRTFAIVPTGGQVDETFQYVGTAFEQTDIKGRCFVWHVYELL